jgi:hypothetical protein
MGFIGEELRRKYMRRAATATFGILSAVLQIRGQGAMDEREFTMAADAELARIEAALEAASEAASPISISKPSPAA